MDFNAKDVVLVFAVVKEVGLVSAEETVDYLKKELKAELDIGNVKIILERLRAKDILTIDQNLRYKVAKIPVPWMSLKMDLVKKFRMKDFKESVEDVDNMFPSAETIVPQPKGMYKNYILMEVEFEAIDRILGGVPKGEKEPLQVHRNAKKQPVVSAGQMYGWFRENERLIGANANAHAHAHGWIGFAEAVPVDGTELAEVSDLDLEQEQAPIQTQKQGGCGIGRYEAFPAGTKFRTYMSVATEGDVFTKDNYVDLFTKLFKWCSIAPVRGLGANPRYNGGRIRLISVKQVDAMTVGTGDAS